MVGSKPLLAIIEDDPFVGRLYESKLAPYFEIIRVSDGAEALTALRSRPPHLVLLDVILPHRNGFELLKDIKSDETLQKIPVIILSVLGQESDIQRGLSLGALDYIVKSSTSIDEVVGKILRHCRECKILVE